MPVLPRTLKLALAALAAAALAPTAAQAASPGVNLRGDIGNPAVVQRALDTGATQVRLFIDWSYWEPTGPAPSLPYDNGAGALTATDNMRGKTFEAIRTIKAAGRRVLLVVTGAPGWANGGQPSNHPPVNADDYATFVARLVHTLHDAGTPVDGVEVWNEEDGKDFWGPEPDAARYTALLRATYAKVKDPAAGDPSTQVYTGPTVGNDYGWIEALYANGAQGSFDGVSVHTDTACLDRGPDSFYRENGRLARFTFLGYREVRAQMLAHGDDKPIIMSELGWSSTGGAANSCTRGDFAGQKPDGVTEAQQAQYLTQAYQCLANDPYVKQADWFQAEDETGNALNEFNHYGLYRTSGAGKPSLAAFRAVAAAGGGAAGPCGDFTAPVINVISPTPNQQFVDKLDLRATAKDAGVGLGRISFFADDSTAEIRNFTGDALKAPSVGLTPWQGSGGLALGAHTIRVTAIDNNGNQAEVRVPVQKVKTMKATLTPRFKLSKKALRCKGRTCTFRGTLSRNGKGRPSIGGKVAVAWELRNKQGKWRKLSGGLKPASKSFAFKAKLKHAGRWRVRATYKSVAPYKSAISSRKQFRVR